MTGGRARIPDRRCRVYGLKGGRPPPSVKPVVPALPDGTAVGYEALVEAASLVPRFLPVPAEAGRTWCCWAAENC